MEIIKEIEFLQSDDAAVCVVYAQVGNRVRVFRGTSKRHPDDKPNLDKGKALAYARAFKQLAKALGNKA